MIKKKIIKLFIAIFIICFMCINCFAAIVSEADGQLFVTKKEFDDVKLDFAKQIDDYGNSISKKIDGIIAQTLKSMFKSDEYSISFCGSKLGYPLVLYMSNKTCKPADFTSVAAANSWWTPKYSIYHIFERGHRWAVPLQYVYVNSAMSDFLFGTVEADSSGTKYFLAESLIKNYSATVNGIVNIHTWADTNVELNSASLTLDQKASREYSNVSPLTRNAADFLTDYDKLYRFPTLSDTERNDTASLPITIVPYFIQNANATMNWTTTAGSLDKYNKVAASGGNQYCLPRMQYTGYDKLFSTAVYDTEDITKLMVVSPTTSATPDRVTPVAYNEMSGSALSNKPSVYATNVKKAKIVYNNNAKTPYDMAKANATDGKYNVCSLVDPGIMLEPEGYGKATRNWWNKSLINPDHIYYEVDLPVTKDTEIHKMTDGFLITEFPTDKEVDFMKVTLDVTLAGTDTKYISFSTDKISERDQSNITGASTNYLLIGTNNDKMTERKLALHTGENIIYIATQSTSTYNGLKYGDKIYMKILWGLTSDYTVTINKEPVLTYFS